MHEKKKEHLSRLMALGKSFLKIGAFTFGGGYTMIPLIAKEMVEEHGWISDKEMVDILAVAECTPGVIAVNCATFVGYKVAGYSGAALATFCVIFPAFLIIAAISLFIEPFKKFQWVAYAFSGIHVGIVILLLQAMLKFFKYVKRNLLSYILIVGAFAVSAFTNLNTIWILFGAIIVGILVNVFEMRYYGKDEE